MRLFFPEAIKIDKKIQLIKSFYPNSLIKSNFFIDTIKSRSSTELVDDDNEVFSVEFSIELNECFVFFSSSKFSTDDQRAMRCDRKSIDQTNKGHRQDETTNPMEKKRSTLSIEERREAVVMTNDLAMRMSIRLISIIDVFFVSSSS